MQSTTFYLFVFILFLSCDSKPKVVKAVEDDLNPSETIEKVMNKKAGTSAYHRVKVLDILHAEKYSYLQVTEKGEKFWIAIPRSEVKKGGIYYYKGGLKKRNFKSVEFDRTFETIYLVGNISEQHPGGPLGTGSSVAKGSLVDEVIAKSEKVKIDPNYKASKMNHSVDIADIYRNKANYDGKEVLVRGKVVKVNNGIMGKNWVHLVDGSGEKQMDLTITTQDRVMVGQEVAFTGKIELDKDFGAGYRYNVIMEEARMISIASH